MSVPHKLKIFAWHACQNGLPCFQNLVHRRVNIDGNCMFCAALMEDIAHALIYCPSVRNVWTGFIPWIEEFDHPLNFQVLLLRVFNSKKLEGLSLLFVIAWGIWCRRNKHIYEDIATSPYIAISNVLAYQSMHYDCLVLPTTNLKKFGCWLLLE